MVVQPLRALFQKRLEGDDALLRLAKLRFEQAGLAAEVYAGSPDELDTVLGFVPSGGPPPTVHLSRRLDLLRQADRDAVATLAQRFAGRVAGFVVHDRADMPDRLNEWEAAAGELSGVLGKSGQASLFIEYAAGCQPEEFLRLAGRLVPIEGVGVCVDTGHVGIRQARRSFARRCPDLGDLAALDPTDPRLPELAGDVQASVADGGRDLIELMTALGGLSDPVHHHLHDGHPLVRGLPDHRGFLTRLPIPFLHRGRSSLDPLFGPAGLAAIIRTAAEAYRPGLASFSLEIHEGAGRLPLDDAAFLFPRWRDTTNAERMNAWLNVLAENAALVQAC
jgi:hypothetical protein